jgi:hypothetical protein
MILGMRMRDLQRCQVRDLRVVFAERIVCSGEKRLEILICLFAIFLVVI